MLEGVVGACLEQPLADLWLFTATHGVILT